MFCEGVKYLFDSLKCKSIYNFLKCVFLDFIFVILFVSGQTYKISRGSNIFFPHCICCNLKTLSDDQYLNRQSLADVIMSKNTPLCHSYSFLSKGLSPSKGEILESLQATFMILLKCFFIFFWSLTVMLLFTFVAWKLNTSPKETEQIFYNLWITRNMCPNTSTFKPLRYLTLLVVNIMNIQFPFHSSSLHLSPFKQ